MQINLREIAKQEKKKKSPYLHKQNQLLEQPESRWLQGCCYIWQGRTVELGVGCSAREHAASVMRRGQPQQMHFFQPVDKTEKNIIIKWIKTPLPWVNETVLAQQIKIWASIWKLVSTNPSTWSAQMNVWIVSHFNFFCFAQKHAYQITTCVC